ncbi:MAG: germination protein YpeB [Clostridia bacterium]|nr:germination protein YpeB [Clostridia bacterium]
MKKETQNISKNTSSGAEKVEKIEKEIKKTNGKATSKTATVKRSVAKEMPAKGDAALGDSAVKTTVKKTDATTPSGKAEAESAAAKARVEAAIQRKEAKDKRKAERLQRAAKRKEERAKRAAEFKAKIAKRSAAKKAEIEKRAAERKARIEKRKAEKEEKIRQRAHAKANRKQAQSKKRAEKSKRKPNKKEHGERRENRGYGGWIAAVVALGVTTLALATTVTVGAVEMRNATNTAMSAYRGTMYELTGILERVENDLDRARISDSSTQQSRILTDLLVQARLAELDVEKLPVEAEADRNVTIFVNRTAMECERMLSKLRNGEKLSAEDRATLEQLYQTNHAVREEINNLVSNMTDKDLMNFVKKGEGMVADTMKKLEKMTMDENRIPMEKTSAPAPEQKTKDGEKPSRIEAVRAEELCAQYFQSYNVKEFQCTGETVSRGYSAYNVQGYDDKGTLLFAEISQDNGALIRFDFYEECSGETFDLQNAERIAEEFLEKLGYDDMEAVRCRQNGSTSDFTFVYEDDGVAYYPDEIHVKVCRTRGVVSGMDASKYLKNHKGRDEVNVKITLAEAYEKLYDGLNVEASRVAVIKTARGEKTAYEMLCSYAEEKYLIYLDATTGEELSIININTIQ